VPAEAAALGQEESPDQSAAAGNLDTLKNNPQTAAVMERLINNPKIQEAARDPEFLDAARSGNMQELLKNPKFQELINSREIQDSLKAPEE